MPSSVHRRGSAVAAIVAGILTFVVLGWVSIYGWLGAGLVAGLIARGSGRGTITAIVSGAIVSGILIALSILVTPSTLTSYISYAGSNVLISHVTQKVEYAMTLQPVYLIRTLVIGAIIVPAIGGFIGGSIMSPVGRYEEDLEEMHEEVPEAQ